jgi:hypothetical protein
MEPHALQRALNGLLPADVRVMGADRAAAGFHPRKSAVSKLYRYVLDFGGVQPPQRARYAGHHVGLTTTEGVYKSADAGGSWNLVNPVVMATDVRIHPGTPSVIYAAHGNFGTTGHGIYRSVNSGQTWTKLPNGLPASWTGKVQLAISPISPYAVWASVANESGWAGKRRRAASALLCSLTARAGSIASRIASRDSSCRKATSPASRMRMPAPRHSSKLSSSTASISARSAGWNLGPSTAAASRTRLPGLVMRAARARTASRTVGGREVPPVASTSLTKKGLPPVR